MKTLHVHSQQGSYPVMIGDGLLSSVGDSLIQLKLNRAAKVCIVTDTTVASLGIADVVKSSCINCGFTVVVKTVPPGDGSKSLRVVEEIYHLLLRERMQRSGIVLAVGGGVVGDLAGFVAATFLRGVHFVQIPTTLLAHDSSIGGKVAVNLAEGKNLIGAFYPPCAVIYDTSTFRTLPLREWRGGMAEVIKHAILDGEAFFKALEQSPMGEYFQSRELDEIIARAMSVKIGIVEEDELEHGKRMWLNVGHTVGHAIELISRYQLNHGEAIAQGMVVEAMVSVHRGWLSDLSFKRIRHLFAIHGLPNSVPDYPFQSVADAMNFDKKNQGANWTCALIRGFGDIQVVHDVSFEEVQRAWDECREEGS